jgi:hypothetical protein
MAALGLNSFDNPCAIVMYKSHCFYAQCDSYSGPGLGLFLEKLIPYAQRFYDTDINPRAYCGFTDRDMTELRRRRKHISNLNLIKISAVRKNKVWKPKAQPFDMMIAIKRDQLRVSKNPTSKPVYKKSRGGRRKSGNSKMTYCTLLQARNNQVSLILARGSGEPESAYEDWLEATLDKSTLTYFPSAPATKLPHVDYCRLARAYPQFCRSIKMEYVERLVMNFTGPKCNDVTHAQPCLCMTDTEVKAVGARTRLLYAEGLTKGELVDLMSQNRL